MSEDFSLKIFVEAVDKATDTLKGIGQEISKTTNTIGEMGKQSTTTSEDVKKLRSQLREAAFEANAVERAFKVTHDTIYDFAEVCQGVAGIVGRMQHMFTQYQVTQIRLIELQEKVNKAHEDYVYAVQKYGEGSKQAREAARKLTEAQRDLETATFQANMQMVGFALQIPGLAKNVLDLVAKIKDLAAGSQALSTVMNMLQGSSLAASSAMGGVASSASSLLGVLGPLALGIAGIAGALAGLKALHEWWMGQYEKEIQQRDMSVEEIDKEIQHMREMREMMGDDGAMLDSYIEKLEEEKKRKQEVINTLKSEKTTITDLRGVVDGWIERERIRVEYEKQLAEEQEKLRKAEEERRKTIQNLTNDLIKNANAIISIDFGPFTKNIDTITENISKLLDLGVKLPSSFLGAFSAIDELNRKLGETEGKIKTLSEIQQIASFGLNYYSTQVSLSRGLIADQIYEIRSQIEELRGQEEALRSSGKATEEQINSIRQQRAELELQLQTLEQNTSLTWQQAASQERLKAIQDALSFTTQILSLQQTALQLAMLGAGDASNTLMNASFMLVDALSDGVITSDEYKAILEMLGITFNDTGQPVINLKGIMEEFRKTVIDNINTVNNFRDALRSLDGMTAHTYHYHHVITVGEGGGGEAREAAEKLAEHLPPAQHGAWFTSEGAYYLHRGEMVLPRSVAEWFRQGGAITASSKTFNVSVNVNASGTSNPYELAEIVSRELVRRLRGLGM